MCRGTYLLRLRVTYLFETGGRGGSAKEFLRRNLPDRRKGKVRRVK